MSSYCIYVRRRNMEYFIQYFSMNFMGTYVNLNKLISQLRIMGTLQVINISFKLLILLVPIAVMLYVYSLIINLTHFYSIWYK